MKERPILFSAPMVRAILAGTKTQTRRVIKPQPELRENAGLCWRGVAYGITTDRQPYVREFLKRCPYGAPGDRLWVRETWQALHVSIDPETGYGDDVRAADKIPSDSRHGYWGVAYAATDPQAHYHKDDRGFPWRPGIHMPRWASRITLEVTGVRVERLHDITEIDARAEGVEPADNSDLGHWHAFSGLWIEINGAESWRSNPWVWAVEFRRVEAQERAA